VDTILIVDDDADLRQIVRSLIRSKLPGSRVLELDSAAGVLELVRKSRPGLVVLDWVLGKGDGAAVCRELKEDPDTRDIPVILLTGSRRAIEDRFASVECGADLYLEKPFKNSELVGYAKALLEKVRPRPRLRGTAAAGEIRISREDRMVRVGDREIPDLPETQFMVLWLLVRHFSRVISTERLVRYVWNNEVRDQQVAVAVSLLKDRLGPLSEVVLEAVPNVGYRLRRL